MVENPELVVGRMPNRGNDATSCLFWIPAEITFPDANDSPAQALQTPRHEPITSSISFDLCNPVLGVPPSGELDPSLSPAPPVPKVAVAENDNLASSNHYVRVTEYVFGMQTITNTRGREQFPQQDFRPCVFASIRSADATGSDAPC